MSKKTTRGKNPRAEFFVRHGEHNVPLSFEMLDSEAFNTLTATERIVLIDLMRVFVKASGWGTKPIPKGIAYSYSHCSVDVSLDTFTLARRRIVERGFFTLADHLKDLRAGSPSVFLPSEAWRRYKPTAEEASRARKRIGAKSKRTARDNQRRATFRGESRKATRETPKVAPRDETPKPTPRAQGDTGALDETHRRNYDALIQTGQLEAAERYAKNCKAKGYAVAVK